ncbi:MAG: hypothetical protein WA294_22865 [Acidobacteriaceae bacterium]
MEEQFYLVWPVTLLLLGVKRCRWLAVAAVLACAAWRYAHWSFYSHVPSNYRTEARADALLVGCLLAIVMAEKSGAAFVAHWAKWWALPALAGLAFCLLHDHRLPPLSEDICIAALIAATVQFPGHPLAKWLDFWPLAQLGVVSYSVYVWHDYFLQTPRHGPIFTPLMIVAVAVFALASYHFLEKPLRDFGHRLTSKSSPRRAAPSIGPDTLERLAAMPSPDQVRPDPRAAHDCGDAPLRPQQVPPDQEVLS